MRGGAECPAVNEGSRSVANWVETCTEWAHAGAFSRVFGSFGDGTNAAVVGAMKWLSLAFALTTLCLLGEARAQGVPQETGEAGPRREPSVIPEELPLIQRDPLVPASIAVGSTGTALAIVGGTLWATNDPPPVCGDLGGCLPGKDLGPRRETGTAMIGFGAGMALTSAAGLAMSFGDPLRPGEERDAPGTAVTGLVLTSWSVGALGGGLMFGGLGAERADWASAMPFFVAGGIGAAVGVPLLFIGASHEDEAERAQERKDAAHDKAVREAKQQARREKLVERAWAIEHGKTEVKSPAMIGIGSGALIAGLGGGIALFAAGASIPPGGFLSSNGFDRLGYFAGGFLALGHGLGAGIPLIVVGARQVPKTDHDHARDPLRPSRVDVGPTNASVTWSF